MLLQIPSRAKSRGNDNPEARSGALHVWLSEDGRTRCLSRSHGISNGKYWYNVDALGKGNARVTTRDLSICGKESTAGEGSFTRRTAGSGPRVLYFLLAFDLHPTNDGSTEACIDLPHPSLARHGGARFCLLTVVLQVVFCLSLGIVSWPPPPSG